MIILTKTQAESVRGRNDRGVALDPIQLADSVTYVLPEAVLADPRHADDYNELSVLPRRAVTQGEWKVVE